jgi:hypothetical protein
MTRVHDDVRPSLDAGDGAVGTATVGANSVPVNYPSRWGSLMGMYLIMGAALTAAFERCSWMMEVVHVEPWMWTARAVGYTMLAAPGLYVAYDDFSLMPPLVGAICWLIVGGLNGISMISALPTKKEWSWEWFESGATKKKNVDQGAPDMSFVDTVLKAPQRMLRNAFEKDTLGRTTFLLVYTALNAYFFFDAANRHGNSNLGLALRGEPFYLCGPAAGAAPTGPCPAGEGPSTQPTAVQAGPLPILQNGPGGVGAGTWYPVAKGFGQLLNLNCAVMLLPVVRSLIRKCHDITSLHASGFLSWLPFWVPFDKNIVFHKAVAKYFIWVSVFGHATAHYYNYGFAPYYNAVFTAAGLPNLYPKDPIYVAWHPNAPSRTSLAPGFTGQMLCLIMFTIYSGAHDTVKRRHYETFWYTHHFFVFWFVFLLIHGPVFWQWAIPTLVPYALDRLIVRIIIRGGKNMGLARVYFWGKPGKPDVVTLEFDNSVNDKGVKPVDYWEGHYLYLQCPHVDRKGIKLAQWHPFTISSAPDEPILQVNLRIMPSEHSWTNKVAKYLMLLDPHQTGEVELTSRNPTTGEATLGKVIGPDGQPFFRVDAPHGAPSQHVFQYKCAMLVGAGIGVTPCASIMKGIVNYRWKKGFRPEHLHFYWVARLTDLTTFKWLLLMLPELKRQQLVHNEYYGGDQNEQAVLKVKKKNLQKAVADGGGGKPSGLASLPPGWEETRTPTGEVYFFNAGSGATAWVRPGADSAGVGQNAAEELAQVKDQLRAASTLTRSLHIVLYLTGCKPDQIKKQPDAKPGSQAEMINALLSTSDPDTGEPYITLKAGRPDWDKEFLEVGDLYGREDVGVVFCGAPMIAAALKEACWKHSNKEKTVFRLHKENF